VSAIRWSSRSIADLEAIRAFIAQDSEHYANLVVVRLVRAVGRLVDFPESGRIVPEVGDTQLREVIHRPYRIVYRVRSDLVEIVTVFRASKLLPEADV
jgi:plasmid stabilization system protein ParE